MIPWRMYRCLKCGRMTLLREDDPKTNIKHKRCDCGGEYVLKGKWKELHANGR